MAKLFISAALLIGASITVPLRDGAAQPLREIDACQWRITDESLHSLVAGGAEIITTVPEAGDADVVLKFKGDVFYCRLIHPGICARLVEPYKAPCAK